MVNYRYLFINEVITTKVFCNYYSCLYYICLLHLCWPTRCIYSRMYLENLKVFFIIKTLKFNVLIQIMHNNFLETTPFTSL